MTPHRPFARREWLALLLPLCVFLVLPAATMNGDGLSYYYRSLRDDWGAKFLPGHLLYCPLMSALGHAIHAVAPGVSLASVMLLFNQVSAAATVWLLLRTAARLGAAPLWQWIGAMGLAFSHGFWIQATDVETYAAATLMVVASVHRMACYAEHPTLRNVVLLGVFNSLAALFHLATGALVIASCLVLWLAGRDVPARRFKSLAVYAVTLLFALGIPVLTAAWLVLDTPSVPGILAWLKSSEHGYAVQLGALSIPRAIYGATRTLVYLESFWAGPRWLIAIKGVAAVVFVTWAMIRGIPMWKMLGAGTKVVGTGLGVFAVFQAALGIYYFGSDAERWVFLAPLFWLGIAALLSLRSSTDAKVAVAAITAMFAVNLTQSIWPSAMDDSNEQRVRALSATAPEDILLITLGQDWTSYYHFYTGERVERVSLIGLALEHRRDEQAFFDDLERRIRAARKEQRPVLLLRVLDPDENHKEGAWPDLAAFGYTARKLQRWFERYGWREFRLGDPQRTRAYWLEDAEVSGREEP